MTPLYNKKKIPDKVLNKYIEYFYIILMIIAQTPHCQNFIILGIHVLSF